MWKKLAVTVGALAGLMLIGYLLALIPAPPNEESPATETVETPERRERSWLGDMIHAWKVTRPKDDGIRRVKSIYPDSDTSECVGVTKTSDQMITTRFAGHVLRYPCTANHHGRSSVHYNEANELIYQNHALYLGVLVGPGKKTIWRRSHDEYSNGKKSFEVKLSSDGETISNEPIRKWIADATKIAEFEEFNIAVYLNGHDINAFILDAMNDQEGYPRMNCLGSTAERALDLFDPSRPPFERAVCDGSWNLNEYIRVRVQISDSTMARDFDFLYQKIDQGLRGTIVRTPEETTSSN